MPIHVSRRHFLGCSAAGGALLMTPFAAGARPAPVEEGWIKLPPVKIHTVYVGRTGDIYLSRPTDEIAKFKQYLAGTEKKLGDINQSLLTSNSVLNAPSIVNPVTNPEPGSTMSNIRAKIMARLASLSSTPNRAIIEINNTNGVIGGNVTASVTDNRADGRQDNRIINKNGAGVYGSIDPATGMPLAAPLPSAATQSGQPVASAAEIAKAQGDAQVAAAKQISDNAKKQAAKEDGLTLLGTGIGSAFGLPFIGGAIGKFLGKIF